MPIVLQALIILSGLVLSIMIGLCVLYPDDEEPLL